MIFMWGGCRRSVTIHDIFNGIMDVRKSEKVAKRRKGKGHTQARRVENGRDQDKVKYQKAVPKYPTVKRSGTGSPLASDEEESEDEEEHGLYNPADETTDSSDGLSSSDEEGPQPPRKRRRKDHTVGMLSSIYKMAKDTNTRVKASSMDNCDKKCLFRLH